MSDVRSSEPAPARSTRGRRWRRAGAAGAIGLGLALGAVGISAAASPSPSPGSSTVRPEQGFGSGMGQHMRDLRGGPGMGRMRDELGMRGAIRGDVVVPDGKGGWRTVRMQRGTVTAKTASSITVKSADGHEETYAVPASALVNAARDGLGSIAVGDEVAVRATVSGSTATATHIRDVTKLGADRPRRPRQGTPDGTSASPSSYRS